MRNLSIALMLILCITLISCDPEDGKDLTQKVDCIKLTSGLLSYNHEMVKTEFDKITMELTPIPDTDDPIGHKDNFHELNNELKKCDLITSELLCYACIETYPVQTEILISIDSSGQTVKRIVDILTPEDNPISFHRVHEYNSQGLGLQED